MTKNEIREKIKNIFRQMMRKLENLELNPEKDSKEALSQLVELNIEIAFVQECCNDVLAEKYLSYQIREILLDIVDRLLIEELEKSATNIMEKKFENDKDE